MPPFNGETIVELRGAQNEVGGHEVVDCAHADDSDQHEPSTDVAEGSGNATGCKDRDPAVLTTCNGITISVN